MIQYELVNPCDPYTFTAPDREVAALVIGALSPMYGAETEDKDESKSVPVLFDGFTKWFEETFHRPVEESTRARKRELGEALGSVMLGGFADRKRYEAALEAIDDPVKKEKFIRVWDDGRTSMNRIGQHARNLSAAVLLSLSEEESSK
jgi:hypothetical protein